MSGRRCGTIFLLILVAFCVILSASSCQKKAEIKPDGGETNPQYEASIGTTPTPDSSQAVTEPETTEAETTEAETTEAETADSKTDDEGATEAVTDYVPVDPQSSSVFDNSLFIGDSRTIGLSRYGDLGRADVFATSGLNVFRALKETIVVKDRECDLNTLLDSKNYDKIYIMLGLNEIGYDKGAVIRKYTEIVDTLKEQCPDARIVIMANLHIVGERSETDDVYNNGALNSLNEGMKSLADGDRIQYLDVNPLFDDMNGALNGGYSFDDFHLLGRYYMQWSQWLAKESVFDR